MVVLTTVCGHRMADRKWKEGKQQPSMLLGSAVPGSSLVSSYFLWAILCPQAVYDVRESYIFPRTFETDFTHFSSIFCLEKHMIFLGTLQATPSFLGLLFKSTQQLTLDYRSDRKIIAFQVSLYSCVMARTNVF